MQIRWQYEYDHSIIVNTHKTWVLGHLNNTLESITMHLIYKADTADVYTIVIT